MTISADLHQPGGLLVPRDKRRSIRTRRPRELDAAMGMTLISATMAFFFLIGGGMNGKQSPIYVVVTAILAAVFWWWAIRTIRARNAAGKTLEQIQALSPEQFEEWVGARFRDLGYSVKVTGLSGDHGADLLAEKQGEVAVIQCKNYKAWSVGEPILRDLYGTMHDFKATKAYLVTTGQLTKAAAEWVKGKPIEVWDSEYLVSLSARLADKRPTASPGETAESPASVGHRMESPVADSTGAPTCPKCGSTLVARRNRNTREAFWGCSKYPACRHTQPLVEGTL